MPEEKKVEVKEHNKGEVLIDFEGTAKSTMPKVLIQEDVYAGRIESVELIEVPAYNKPGITEKKIVFQVQLSSEGSDNALLPLYANPVIKKSGGKGYNNSKLYDLLEKGNELEQAKKSPEQLKTFKGLTDFFATAFNGRKCKALVKIRNRGTDNAYSTIGSIVKFEPMAKEKNQEEAKELL